MTASEAIRALLDQAAASGRITRFPAQLPAADVVEAARAARRQAGLLDLAGVTGKAEFMERCARHLALPDWFGRNWDALHDCLTDPDWRLPGPAGDLGRVVVVSGWREYADAAAGEWDIAQRVFTDASGYWRGTGTPLAVLLQEGAVTAPAPPTPGTSG